MILDQRYRIWLALMLMAGSGCDSVQPEQTGSLVVETFMSTEERPEDVILSTTVPLSPAGASPGVAAASGAVVALNVNDEPITYIEGSPGHYSPPPAYDAVLRTGDEFRLQIQWEGTIATASGIIPPPIRLDSIVINVPSEPVEAILVDSLRLDTLGVDATTGYIFPIETTTWWTWENPAAFESWIHAQLRPQREFSSVVVNFFLLPEEVFRESDAPQSVARSASWTGLYAIPVERPDAPLPSHELRVALVRSGRAYADFAIGRFDPDGRGPPSNVNGALGIAAGVSVDSVLVQVESAEVGRKSLVYAR